jgi:tetratricopeptide (TPR) repeat protein
MTQIVDDIRAKYEPNWTRRGMWDRAYYEARMPACPTMLLELLSHQNFADMRYGHDPSFQFDVSRAIYKGILRYLSSQNGVDYTVAPLPVNSFAIELCDNKANISWAATVDPLEPTATPDYYILYTRIGESGFDNGKRVENNSTTITLEPGKHYSFRITAVNKGGESFDSETLSACYCKNSPATVMIINGFDRVAAPMSQQGDSIAGFYNNYALALYESENYDEALRYFRKALNILSLYKGNDSEIAVIFCNLSHLFEKTNDNEMIDNCLNSAFLSLKDYSGEKNNNFLLHCQKCIEAFKHFNKDDYSKEIEEKLAK